MMLDVFTGDAFSYTNLVAAINKIPYVPTRLGSLRLFNEEGVNSTKLSIEMQNGVLTLVQSGARGSRGAPKGEQKRNVRNFNTIHLPQSVSVVADEVANLRPFGSETETDTAMAMLTRKMAIARRDVDITHEWQRMGALKGIVLDADGSTIYDYFTEFGVSQTTIDMALDDAATKVRGKCNSVTRFIEDQLGGVMMSGVHVMCSKEFFDALIDHPAVVDTYKYTDGAPLRASQRKVFEFGDLTFEEYRGTIGGTRFIAANEAYAFPLGVPDLFKTFYAPADYMDTVNTIGLPFYMRGRTMDFEKGLDYDVQSNPLHMNTRPETVVKLTV